MSKEKQCECCHEWWYDSDVKENLCPNCYDYFKQLKQQLEEKEKQIDIISRDNNSYKYNIDEQKRIIDDFAKQLKEKDNYHLRYELAGADETITNLKQQLEEKDKLLKCYQDEEKQIADILGDKDLTIIGSRVHLKNLIVELKNKIKDKDIVIEEKDKEIEELKTKQKPIVMHPKENYYFLEEENIKLHFAQKQLAIQELEKVKMQLKDKTKMMSNEEHCYQQKVVSWLDICNQTNNQIKELKGE